MGYPSNSKKVELETITLGDLQVLTQEGPSFLAVRVILLQGSWIK